jgi:hypothetical protein
MEFQKNGIGYVKNRKEILDSLELMEFPMIMMK